GKPDRGARSRAPPTCGPGPTVIHFFRRRSGSRPAREVDVRISVIGCGYLGAVHAASLVELGHDVVGIDVDERRIRTLSQARAPFYEPEFTELLRASLATGRLRFSTDITDAAGARVHFVCVGTP